MWVSRYHIWRACAYFQKQVGCRTKGLKNNYLAFTSLNSLSGVALTQSWSYFFYLTTLFKSLQLTHATRYASIKVWSVKLLQNSSLQSPSERTSPGLGTNRRLWKKILYKTGVLRMHHTDSSGAAVSVAGAVVCRYMYQLWLTAARRRRPYQDQQFWQLWWTWIFRIDLDIQPI